MNWKRTACWSWLIVPFLLLALWPGAAAAKGPKDLVADIVLYEVWENVFPTPMDEGGAPIGTPHLDRLAAISGSAKLDSPVCVVAASFLYNHATTCNLTAVGTNHIQLGGDGKPTGVIKAIGEFAVVVQLFDVPGFGSPDFDSPEFVVTTGAFEGDTVPLPIPPGTPKRIKRHFKELGFIPLLGIENGKLTIVFPDQTSLSFNVVTKFRLPFAFDDHGKVMKPRHGHDAFYLGDEGRLIRVRRDELSLGFATVRIEFTLLGPVAGP